MNTLHFTENRRRMRADADKDYSIGSARGVNSGSFAVPRLRAKDRLLAVEDRR
ncbi:MAG TPA: hypothetical protein VHC70_12125 [Phycisphaerales bacterium]|nr:hypothetical protein [Phycisphaerales bacterium]